MIAFVCAHSANSPYVMNECICPRQEENKTKHCILHTRSLLLLLLLLLLLSPEAEILGALLRGERFVYALTLAAQASAWDQGPRAFSPDVFE